MHQFQPSLVTPHLSEALQGLLGLAAAHQIGREHERPFEPLRGREVEEFRRRFEELERRVHEHHNRLERREREAEQHRRQMEAHQERIRRVEEMHRGLREEFETNRGRGVTRTSRSFRF